MAGLAELARGLLLGLRQPMGNGQGVAPMGIRHDGGGAKGKGYYGALPGADGRSTEISVETEINGRPMEIPAMVPTLTLGELQQLLSGGPVTDDIYRKAVQFAMQRNQSGQSPFAGQQSLYQTPGMLGSMER